MPIPDAAQLAGVECAAYIRSCLFNGSARLEIQAFITEARNAEWEYGRDHPVIIAPRKNMEWLKKSG
jgi:hypothetical protein